MPVKLGRTAKERTALLRGLASQLLWYGKIETTEAKAKALQPYVEKIITKAVRTFDDNVEIDVVKKDNKGNDITVKSRKDGAKKLAARRSIMTKVYDLQEPKAFNETRKAYRKRTADINHPLIEKIFDEIAPKYAQRAEEKGQGGGYTRVYRLGDRRGDNAATAIIELV